VHACASTLDGTVAVLLVRLAANYERAHLHMHARTYSHAVLISHLIFSVRHARTYSHAVPTSHLFIISGTTRLLRASGSSSASIARDGTRRLPLQVGGASALVTFICVLCTLRTQISQSICNFIYSAVHRVGDFTVKQIAKHDRTIQQLTRIVVKHQHGVLYVIMSPQSASSPPYRIDNRTSVGLCFYQHLDETQVGNSYIRTHAHIPVNTPVHIPVHTHLRCIHSTRTLTLTPTHTPFTHFDEPQVGQASIPVSISKPSSSLAYAWDDLTASQLLLTVDLIDTV
jgi:hypothetical protein